MDTQDKIGPRAHGAAQFCTTHWSVVHTAGEAESPQALQALESLCRAYWYPLYTFIRRQGKNPEDAEDLTQGFFSHLLEKKRFANASQERGKFRTFLLGSLKNFMVNEWRYANRLKRGGEMKFLSLYANEAEGRYAAEPSSNANPDLAYEERWAATLIERVLATVRQEYASTGKVNLFEGLKSQLWGAGLVSSYADLAASLSMTEGALKMAVYRLRQRFRELLRSEIARTVERPEEVDAELRYLISVVGSSGG